MSHSPNNSNSTRITNAHHHDTTSGKASPFTINGHQIILDRFPHAKHVDASLQAWDAADEYIIQHLIEQQLPQPSHRILLFNDQFGALACALSNNPIVSSSDSYISHQGTLANFSRNHLNIEKLSLKTSIDKITDPADIIILKIPKSNALLIEQLITINQIANKNTVIIAAARAKDIHRSTLGLFEQYIGSTTTSLAVKKARLVFPIKEKAAVSSPYPTVWSLDNTLTISNHANVFSREKLDIGGQFFRQHLPSIAPNYRVIDLGCGNGIIGLTVLQQQTKANVSFIDESFMAIASAKENVIQNFPEHIHQCQFIANDCLTNIASDSADLILCNPPFHQQQAVTDHIAWQMFKDSFRVLKKGGELRIIGNRQLGYHVKLKRLFGRCQTIASNKKFVILSTTK